MFGLCEEILVPKVIDYATACVIGFLLLPKQAFTDVQQENRPTRVSYLKHGVIVKVRSSLKAWHPDHFSKPSSLSPLN